MRKLMLITIGLVASLVLSVYIMQLNYCIFLIHVCIVLLLVLFLFRKAVSFWRIASVILIGCILGVSLITGFDFVYLAPAREIDGENIDASVTVTDYSYTIDKNNLVEGKININGEQYTVLIYYNEDIDFSPGDQIYGNFRMRFTGIGGNQESTYHQGNGIFLLAFADENISYVKSDFVPLQYYAAKVRLQIISILENTFPEDTSAFARALLLGDSSKLPFQMDNAFKVSGIRHIIAVSGLHVSILFSLIYILAGKRKLLTALIGIPTLFFFAAIAGFTPSVVRACIMQGLLIMALLLNREYDPPTALSFAVFVMLLINPLAITSVSLQLSAGCMVGIFCFSSKINNYLLSDGMFGPAKGKGFKANFKRWFAGSVSVSVGAMVTTIPLCAYYFEMFSIVGILTNLLTLWIVSFIFYGIMATCVFYLIWPAAGQLIATIVSWPIQYVIWIAEFLSDMPYAAIYTCSIYTVFWLIFAYTLLLLFVVLRKKRPLVFISCLIASLVITIFASWLEPRLDNYRITIFDVGQGQCILLQSEGKYYLVDCGGESKKAVANDVIHQLNSQGIDWLDGMILTHFDADHIGAAELILSEIKTDRIYVTFSDPDTEMDDMLCDQYADTITTVTNVIQIADNDNLLTIYPAQEGKTGNESSLCVLFQSNNYDILITGDRSIASEDALISQYDIPPLDVLVAGHHGSRNATGLSLLSTAKPKSIVFSVGKDNQFGHPNPETIERVELFGCKIYRTDKQGTITLRG